MSFYVVIPARYDSERLPGKPLIDLHGKPMIQRVYERACLSDALEVHVATDDERIAEAVTSFGGRCVMTSRHHHTGTDRIYEAVKTIGLDPGHVVVNVQGDEPLMPPEAINQVAAAVADDVEMATLREPVTDMQDVFDPNVVKVVTDEHDIALYFSRAPVPWSRQHFSASGVAADNTLENGTAWFRHLGIYAYTVSMLTAFVSWPPSALEQIENLEQLRVLSHGRSIRVLESAISIPPGIDVPRDVERAIAAIKAMEP